MLLLQLGRERAARGHGAARRAPRSRSSPPRSCGSSASTRASPTRCSRSSTPRPSSARASAAGSGWPSTCSRRRSAPTRPPACIERLQTSMAGQPFEFLQQADARQVRLAAVRRAPAGDRARARAPAPRPRLGDPGRPRAGRCRARSRTASRSWSAPRRTSSPSSPSRCSARPRPCSRRASWPPSAACSRWSRSSTAPTRPPRRLILEGLAEPRRGARRGGPQPDVRLRRHRAARGPRHAAGAAPGGDRGPVASRSRASPTRCATRCCATCPSAPARTCVEEIDLLGPVRLSQVEEARAGDRPGHPPPRGERADRHPPRRGGRVRCVSSLHVPRSPVHASARSRRRRSGRRARRARRDAAAREAARAAGFAAGYAAGRARGRRRRRAGGRPRGRRARPPPTADAAAAAARRSPCWRARPRPLRARTAPVLAEAEALAARRRPRAGRGACSGVELADAERSARAALGPRAAAEPRARGRDASGCTRGPRRAARRRAPTTVPDGVELVADPALAPRRRRRRARRRATSTPASAPRSTARARRPGAATVTDDARAAAHPAGTTALRRRPRPRSSARSAPSSGLSIEVGRDRRRRRRPACGSAGTARHRRVLAEVVATAGGDRALHAAGRDARDARRHAGASRWARRCACPSAPACSAGCSTGSAGRSTAAARCARDAWVPVDGHAPHPLDRARVDTPLDLGVRVLDTLVTVGSRSAPRPVRRLRRRQVQPAVDDRARHRRRGVASSRSSASVAVRCASSSRTTSGPRGWPARVVVVATSDEPPLVRLRSAFVATRIAEHLRDGGRARRADDGLAHPRRHGAARDRAVRRRAARHPRLPAEHVRAARPAARARRAPARRGSVTGPLHRARRRRRPQRADRRRRPLDPRRARRPRPPPRRRRALPERRRARLDQPRRVPGLDAASGSAAHAGCAP